MIIQIICFVLPAIFMTFWRNTYLKLQENGYKKLVAPCVAGIILINLVCVIFSKVLYGTNDIMTFLTTGQGIGYWLTFACVIAVLEPIAENFFRNNVFVKIGDGIEISDSKKNIFLLLYMVLLFLVNLVRIFDRTYWADEEYSILMVDRTWGQIATETASDVHPPLYYFLLKIVSHFLGHNGAAYHFTSLLAYSAILVLAYVVIRKTFGYVTTTLFVTFCSVLYNAIRYNVEIRMYSWASFFVLGTGLFYYFVLERNKYRDYIIMALFALGAAYTHYYALISVSFFFVSMIIYSVVTRDKKRIKGMLMGCGIAIIGYLYWLTVLIDTFLHVSKDWWMSFYAKFSECVQFLFYGTNGSIYTKIWIAAAIIVGVYEVGIVKIKKNKRGKPESLSLNFDVREYKCTPILLWIITGFAAVFGTMAVGIWVSYLFRPLFYTKYLYPAAIIAWLMLAVCVSRLKYKNIAGLLVLCLLLKSGVTDYSTLFIKDKEISNNLENTLFYIDQVIDIGGEFLSTKNISYPVDIYYPDHELTILDGNNLDPEMVDINKIYCFVGLEEITDEQRKFFTDEGFRIIPFYAEGYFGDFTVWVYKIQK